MFSISISSKRSNLVFLNFLPFFNCFGTVSSKASLSPTSFDLIEFADLFNVFVGSPSIGATSFLCISFIIFWAFTTFLFMSNAAALEVANLLPPEKADKNPPAPAPTAKPTPKAKGSTSSFPSMASTLVCSCNETVPSPAAPSIPAP